MKIHNRIVLIVYVLTMVHALALKIEIFDKNFKDCQAMLPPDAGETEILYCVLQKDEDFQNENGIITPKKAVAYCDIVISDPVKLIQCQTIVSHCWNEACKNEICTSEEILESLRCNSLYKLMTLFDNYI